eukprot:scaffold186369_cov19-Tisochrysis_lutea.AAC.1
MMWLIAGCLGLRFLLGELYQPAPKLNSCMILLELSVVFKAAMYCFVNVNVNAQREVSCTLPAFAQMRCSTSIGPSLNLFACVFTGLRQQQPCSKGGNTKLVRPDYLSHALRKGKGCIAVSALYKGGLTEARKVPVTEAVWSERDVRCNGYNAIGCNGIRLSA